MAYSTTTTTHPKKVLFAIGHGNEPMESVTIIDVLRRAGAEVTVASVENTNVVEMGFKIKLVADDHITAFTHTTFDLITLPGGIKGCESLRDCKVLENMVKQQIEKERLLSAICAAPAITLEPWEVLKGKEVTCFPGLKDKLSPEVKYVESRVHHYGQLVSSQAPGTGMEFSVALVQTLYGKAKYDEIAKQLILRPRYGIEYEFTELNRIAWTFNGTEPQVLVPIVNDIDAIEATIITDILRRGGANVIVASVENELEIVASQNVKIVADVLLSELAEQSFDLIVLPGGLHGAQALAKSEKLIDLLKQQAKSGKPYGAISYSPAIVLNPNGLLEDNSMAPKTKVTPKATKDSTPLRRSPLKRKAAEEEVVPAKKSKNKELSSNLEGEAVKKTKNKTLSVKEVGASSTRKKGKEKENNCRTVDIVGEKKIIPQGKTVNPFRYSLSKPIELITSHRQYMTEEMKEEIGKTPFSKLFDSMAEGFILRENYNTRPINAILDILCRYKKSTKKFVIGGVELEFKPEDVSLLLGMPMEGAEYDAFPKFHEQDPFKCSFLMKYFEEPIRKSSNKNKGISSAYVAMALQRCIRNQEPAIEFVSLLIMLLAANFLFATLAGFTVLPSIYKNIMSRRAINRVSWPRAIHSYMMETIDKHAEEPTKASGCLLLLPFWVCMHTSLYPKNTLNAKKYPRFLRWSVDDFSNGMESDIAGLEEDQVIVSVEEENSEEEHGLLNFTEKVDIELTYDQKIDMLEMIESLKSAIISKDVEIEMLKKENAELKGQLKMKEKVNVEEFEDQGNDENDEDVGKEDGMEGGYECSEKEEDREVEQTVVDDGGNQHDSDDNYDGGNNFAFDENVPCTTIVKYQAVEERVYSSTPTFDLGIDDNEPSDFAGVAEIAKSYKGKDVLIDEDDDFEEPSPKTVKKARTKSKASKGVGSKQDDVVKTPKQNSLIKRVKEAPRTRKHTEKADPKLIGGKVTKKHATMSKKEVVNVETEEDTKGKKAASDDNEPLCNWKKSKVWKQVKDDEKGLLEEFSKEGKNTTLVWTNQIMSEIRGRQLDLLMMNCETDAQIINWWAKHLFDEVMVGAGQVFILGAELWTMIKCKATKANINAVFKDRILNEADRGLLSFLVAPMCHAMITDVSRGIHWTLLVFDYYDQTWTHYNSLYFDIKMRKVCEENAKKYAQEILDVLHEIQYVSPEYKKKCKELKSPYDHQQGEYADCGPFIMLHMEMLFMKNYKWDVPKDFLSDDWTVLAQRKRAQVTYELLNETKEQWRKNL